MKELKQKRIVSFIKCWFFFQLILTITVFVLFGLNCFVSIPVTLIHFAAFFHFLLVDIVPIVVAIIFFIVCFAFKGNNLLKKLLLKGTGLVLLLCIVDIIYRTLVPENMGTLNDYRNIIVLLFLPIICIVIIAFEVKLSKIFAKK